ncbi:MAG: hypothetical protein MHM6MM_005802 [Cercozoa sp. M6MM]
MSDQDSDHVGDHMSDHMGDQLGDHVGDQISDQTSLLKGDAAASHSVLLDHSDDPDTVDHSVDPSDHIIDHTVDQTVDHTVDHTDHTVDHSTDYSIDHSIDRSVEPVEQTESVQTACVTEQQCESVQRVTAALTGRGLACTKHTRSSWSGPHVRLLKLLSNESSHCVLSWHTARAARKIQRSNGAWQDPKAKSIRVTSVVEGKVSPAQCPQFMSRKLSRIEPSLVAVVRGENRDLVLSFRTNEERDSFVQAIRVSL